MAGPAEGRMSLAEFLERDDGSEPRYELINGRPRAMAPPIEAHDRGVKLVDCRRIASVEQIFLIASEDRHVEVWLRPADGWKVQDMIGDAAIPLAIDGQPLPRTAIYDGVAF
jgi:Uma2 family endonuclease